MSNQESKSKLTDSEQRSGKGLSVQRLVRCPDCEGHGDVPCSDVTPIEETEPCGLCNGYGEITLGSYDEWCKIHSANVKA